VNRQYPVMLNLSGRRAVIIGGGTVALRKARDLLASDALVTVISITFNGEFDALAAEFRDRLVLEERPYARGDLEGALVVFSATNDHALNRKVYEEAKERNIFINAVDDPPHCSFTVPSSFSRGDLVVAISTGGVSPSMSARIRRAIEAVIPDSIEDTLKALSAARNSLQNDAEFTDLSSEQRGTILKQIVMDDDLLGELVTCYKSGTVMNFLKKISAGI
jgi:precorrin-2 dehydrogenase / sirohydrochlorin ferrochelatase